MSPASFLARCRAEYGVDILLLLSLLLLWPRLRGFGETLGLRGRLLRDLFFPPLAAAGSSCSLRRLPARLDAVLSCTLAAGLPLLLDKLLLLPELLSLPLAVMPSMPAGILIIFCTAVSLTTLPGPRRLRPA